MNKLRTVTLAAALLVASVPSLSTTADARPFGFGGGWGHGGFGHGGFGRVGWGGGWRGGWGGGWGWGGAGLGLGLGLATGALVGAALGLGQRPAAPSPSSCNIETGTVGAGGLQLAAMAF